jgi:ornithine cyclodeaminase/alanine dehydrogenase-like protein (mu-crystallin family)
MKVLFLNERDVHEQFEMRAAVPLMREALTTLARGDAVLPLRSMVKLPDGSGILGLMPGYLGAP